MAKSETKAASKLDLLQLLMRPIVRFALRRSLSFQDFLRVAKASFVEVAEQEIKRSTAIVNVSRISVMTGLHRKDVTQIFREHQPVTHLSQSIFARVLGQWEQDKRFTTQDGLPKMLSFQGEKSDFFKLVSSVSKHINPFTVLFELERIGAVKKTPEGLKFMRPTAGVSADEHKVHDLVSRDIDSLINAMTENLYGSDDTGNLHMRTEYDNVFRVDIPEIRTWFIQQGKELHRRAREYLSAFDKDLNPDLKSRGSAGAKVVFSSFSFTTPPSEVEETPKFPLVSN